MERSCRPAIGYDHGYNGKVFYLELYLDPRYVEGFVERCLKRICKDDDGEDVFRGVWEDGDARDFALEAEPITESTEGKQFVPDGCPAHNRVKKRYRTQPGTTCRGPREV